MNREQLIVEFFDQQLWQFISIDEWLNANCQVESIEIKNETDGTQ